MEDHQWRLTSLDGGVDFLFGTLDTGIQTTHAPDLGVREVVNRDQPLPREDGDAQGIDYERGTVLTFEADVLTDDWQGNSDLLNQFRAAWSSRKFRDHPDAYAELRVHAAGRTRVCYGRPRRFGEADGDLTKDGWTPIVCDFATRDGKFYDDVEKVEQIPIRPPTSAGFTTPIIVTGTDPNTLAFQTDTLTPEEHSGAVVVETETWPVVEIHGPVTTPSVQLGDLTLKLDYTIPDGMSVVLDPRPWSRGVRRSDGANLAGKLAWVTPKMGLWLLVPGAYELVYRGTDPTGSSFATLSWREAFHRP